MNPSLALGLWMALAIAILGSWGMGLVAMGMQDHDRRSMLHGAIAFGMAILGIGVASRMT